MLGTSIQVLIIITLIAFDEKENACLISFLRPVSFELVCLCTAMQDTKMAPRLIFAGACVGRETGANL